MLTGFKRILKLFLFLLLVAFLHYNLPDRDIVRVVGTDVKRMDVDEGAFGWGEPDAGTKHPGNKDVRFIYTIRPNNHEMVYRNEDTGWGWPPYFKFDTSDLATQAQDLANRAQKNDEEVWVAVKHYGWRIKLLSLFPNAVDMKEVSGPNDRLIPWFNIAFLTMLAALFLYVWMRIRAFKKRRIDPIGEKIEDAAEAVGDDISEKRSAFRRFTRRWFGSTKE